MKLEGDKTTSTHCNKRSALDKVALLFSFLSLCVYGLTAFFIGIGVSKALSDGDLTGTLRPVLATDLDSGFGSDLADLSVWAFNVIWIFFCVCVFTLRNSNYPKIAFYTALVCFTISVFFMLTVSRDFIVTVTFYLLTSLFCLKAMRSQKTSLQKPGW